MKDTNYYKEKLEAELKLLENELDTVGRRDPKSSDNWEAKQIEEQTLADENDVADDLDEFETNNAIANDLELRHKSVREALERIEKGTYGICEVCGEEIEEERLEANPAATTCMECMGE